MAEKFLVFSSLLLLQALSSHALECFFCNTNSDPTCATLNFNRTRTCIANDECAVWISGYVTFRGCKSEIPPAAPIFSTCSVDLCNRKIFPEERLKCVQCQADNPKCFDPDASLLFPCKNYFYEDECYAHIINETTAVRGCLSDADDNVNACFKNTDVCTRCSEDFCNIQSGESTIECFSCSSERGEACKYMQTENDNTELCKQLIGRENFCFSFKNESVVLRGCLKDFLNATECLANDNCELCDEDNCNKKESVEEFCYQCDSKNLFDCRNNVEKAVVKKCVDITFDKSGCYHYDKDDVVVRGCISDLSETEFRICNGGDVCKTCSQNLCNVQKNFQKCYSCNSQTDPNCATLRRPLPEKICRDYVDSCKVYVKPNQTTHRGCFNEMEPGIECRPTTVNCKQCSENLCNGEVFPPNRLSCAHCQSSDPSSECFREIREGADITFPCETYNFRDSCYLYITEANMTIRGCLSDSSPYTSVCMANPDKCKICQTSNCNSDVVLRPPKLSCIDCDSGSHEKCWWGFSKSSASKCQNDLYFYEEESCFTFHVPDIMVIRGCTIDSNACKGHEMCVQCQGDACNNVQKLEQYCYQCSTKDDVKCKDEPSTLMNNSCEGIITHEYRACYTWSDENEDELTRGCFASLSNDDKLKCFNDEEHCEICLGESCNFITIVKNSVNANGLFIALQIVALITLFTL